MNQQQNNNNWAGQGQQGGYPQPGFNGQANMGFQGGQPGGFNNGPQQGNMQFSPNGNALPPGFNPPIMT